MDVLQICRAIHAKRPIAIRYHLVSSGQSDRVIVPFALVGTGLCWHDRESDRKFGNCVVASIEAPLLGYQKPTANDLPDNDIQRIRIVELDLVSHLRLARLRDYQEGPRDE